MFESLVASLLSKHLGRYIDGLDAKHVHLSIWDGTHPTHDTHTHTLIQ